ncbi:MAG: hypothetical protein ACOC98_15625 [Thermodesulfobacteriota bacterium]
MGGSLTFPGFRFPQSVDFFQGQSGRVCNLVVCQNFQGDEVLGGFEGFLPLPFFETFGFAFFQPLGQSFFNANPLGGGDV